MERPPRDRCRRHGSLQTGPRTWSLPGASSPLSDNTPASSPHCWLPWQKVVTPRRWWLRSPPRERTIRREWSSMMLEIFTSPVAIRPFHRIDLPVVIRCRGLEPLPRSLGPFAWLRFHRTVGPGSMNRRHRRHPMCAKRGPLTSAARIVVAP